MSREKNHFFVSQVENILSTFFKIRINMNSTYFFYPEPLHDMDQDPANLYGFRSGQFIWIRIRPIYMDQDPANL